MSMKELYMKKWHALIAAMLCLAMGLMSCDGLFGDEGEEGEEGGDGINHEFSYSYPYQVIAGKEMDIEFTGNFSFMEGEELKVTITAEGKSLNITEMKDRLLKVMLPADWRGEKTMTLNYEGKEYDLQVLVYGLVGPESTAVPGYAAFVDLSDVTALFSVICDNADYEDFPEYGIVEPTITKSYAFTASDGTLAPIVCRDWKGDLVEGSYLTNMRMIHANYFVAYVYDLTGYRTSFLDEKGYLAFQTPEYESRCILVRATDGLIFDLSDLAGEGQSIRFGVDNQYQWLEGSNSFYYLAESSYTVSKLSYEPIWKIEIPNLYEDSYAGRWFSEEAEYEWATSLDIERLTPEGAEITVKGSGWNPMYYGWSVLRNGDVLYSATRMVDAAGNVREIRDPFSDYSSCIYPETVAGSECVYRVMRRQSSMTSAQELLLQRLTYSVAEWSTVRQLSDKIYQFYTVFRADGKLWLESSAVSKEGMQVTISDSDGTINVHTLPQGTPSGEYLGVSGTNEHYLYTIDQKEGTVARTLIEDRTQNKVIFTAQGTLTDWQVMNDGLSIVTISDGEVTYSDVSSSGTVRSLAVPGANAILNALARIR